MEEKSGAQGRTIKLYCPSLLKLSTIVARDDHRIDIGALARIFGLDPATVKLNDHFIARGVDLVASSVTWKSLLSFFSARRLPTGSESGSGTDHHPHHSSSPFAALLVDGKLSTIPRPKRSHDHLAQVENGVELTTSLQHRVDDDGDKFQSGNSSMCKKKKQRMVHQRKSGFEREDQEGNGDVGFKRKPWQLETGCSSCSSSSSSPLKRFKENGTFSNMFSWSMNSSSKEKENSMPCVTCGGCLGRSSGERAKRAREEEVMLASSCKRAR